jgi:hypothetical protein
VPDLQRAGEAQHGKCSRREHPRDIGHEHEVATVQAIAEGAADE